VSDSVVADWRPGRLHDRRRPHLRAWSDSGLGGLERPLHAQGGVRINRADVLVTALLQGDLECCRLAGTQVRRLLAGDLEVVDDLALVRDLEDNGPVRRRLR